MNREEPRPHTARRRTPIPRRSSLAGLDLGPKRPDFHAPGRTPRYPAVSQTQRGRHAKDRWNSPLGSAASAERVPRRTWWVGGTLALLALGGLMGLHAWKAEVPYWSVQHVEVRGNRILSSEQVLSRSPVEIGTPWWSALGQLGSVRWDDLPRAHSARLTLAGLGGVQIEVTEREHVLRWLTEGNRGVAADGTVLQLAPEFDALDLPCLTGPGAVLPAEESGNNTPLTNVVAAPWHESLMKLRTENPILWADLSQIEIENERRVRLFFRDARRVILWDPHLNGHLWKQVPGILQDLATRGMDEDAVLDMRFRDRVVVRVPEELWYEHWDKEPADGARGSIPAGEGSLG